MILKTTAYQIGTQVKLVRGTTLWAQEHTRGQADVTYVVSEYVDDGTSLDRISLCILGEKGCTFVGISPDLFERCAIQQPLSASVGEEQKLHQGAKS